MKRLVFHPFLFAIYTVLALFANNVDRVKISDTFRIFFLVIAGVAILFLLLRLLVRNWFRAGLLCSLTVLLFTSYGLVYNYFLSSLAFRILIGRANFLAALWAAVYILGGWWIIRVLKDPMPLNKICNFLVIFLMVFPVVQIGSFLVRSVNRPDGTPQSNSVLVQKDSLQQLPDVYYIVLDEYGRSDILQNVLNYDNSDFIDFLVEKGFYVAEKSSANYAITLMSMASSLNSTYLDRSVSPDPKDYPANTSRLVSMIYENKARKIFEQAGYRFVSFATGYSFSEFKDADLYYLPDNYINDFEMEYLKSTLLIFETNQIEGVRYRTLLLNVFTRLAEMPDVATDRPKFIFAHILAGHVPFVFGPNGEEVEPWAFSVYSNGTMDSNRTYVSAYKDQLTYIDQLLETTIDTILSKSQVKPIIIIQGDHGPQSKLDWYSVENTCLEERMSILNAYYLPNIGQSVLYPTITPVNTFRLIYNNYLGLDEEMLANRSYFSLWDKSYQFIDVTDRLDTCSAR